MKYYIISGEPSGDLHGAHLIRAIRDIDSAAEVRAWGGDMMQDAGATIAKHYSELAFMGIIEVVKNLRAILANERFCRRDISAFQPDRLILIDYSGFNLRIAKWAKPAGFDISYYISPQVWAWRSGRVKTIRKTIDRMLVILPFEKEWYHQRGVDAHFVGHPLLDIVHEKEALAQEEMQGPEGQVPTIAILPGSRRQEITSGLPIMIAAATRHPGYNYIIAAAPGQTIDFYEPFLADTPKSANFEIRKGATYDILRHAHAAMVTSGTATLETALFGVPQVVCYRGNAISFAIAKRLVGNRIKYISLVNLIMDGPALPELVQSDFTTDNLTAALSNILFGPGRLEQVAALQELRSKLGDGGAAARAAAIIVQGE